MRPHAALIVVACLILPVVASSQQSTGPAFLSTQDLIDQRIDAFHQEMNGWRNALAARHSMASDLTRLRAEADEFQVLAEAERSSSVVHGVTPVFCVVSLIALLVTSIRRRGQSVRVWIRLAAVIVLILGAMILALPVLASTEPAAAQSATTFDETAAEAARLISTPLISRAIEALESQTTGLVSLPEIRVASAELKPFREVRAGSPPYEFTLAALHWEAGSKGLAEDRLAKVLSADAVFSGTRQESETVVRTARHLLVSEDRQQVGPFLALRGHLVTDAHAAIALARALHGAGVSEGIPALARAGLRGQGVDPLEWGRLAAEAGLPDVAKAAFERSAAGFDDWTDIRPWLQTMSRGSLRVNLPDTYRVGLDLAARTDAVPDYLNELFASDHRASAEAFLIDYASESNSAPMVAQVLLAAAQHRACSVVTRAGSDLRRLNPGSMFMTVLATSPKHAMPFSAYGAPPPMSVGVLIGACYEADGDAASAMRYYQNALNPTLDRFVASHGLSRSPLLMDLHHIKALAGSLGDAPLTDSMASLYRAAEADFVNAIEPPDGYSSLKEQYETDHPEVEPFAAAHEAVARAIELAPEAERSFLLASLPASDDPQAVSKLRSAFTDAKRSHEWSFEVVVRRLLRGAYHHAILAVSIAAWLLVLAWVKSEAPRDAPLPVRIEATLGGVGKDLVQSWILLPLGFVFSIAASAARRFASSGEGSHANDLN